MNYQRDIDAFFIYFLLSRTFGCAESATLFYVQRMTKGRKIERYMRLEGLKSPRPREIHGSDENVSDLIANSTKIYEMASTH